MTQYSPFPADDLALDKILNWTRERIIQGPDPRNGAKSQAALEAALGDAITSDGITATRAFDLFTDGIIPSIRPFNHPTSLAFVAAAPTPASLAFDAALGAAEIFAGNWDGGSGAIYAENQALSWLASLAGWPKVLVVRLSRAAPSAIYPHYMPRALPGPKSGQKDGEFCAVVRRTAAFILSLRSWMQN